VTAVASSAGSRTASRSPSRWEQPLVVAGQYRDRPGPGTADLRDHPAGPAGDVGAADGAQVRAGQAGAGAQADQPGRAHPRDSAGWASASAR
jgi:hypothetical protein